MKPRSELCHRGLRTRKGDKGGGAVGLFRRSDPGDYSHPQNGRGCLRALPQQSDALLAFRADGGVVWSTDGAPLAHPTQTGCPWSRLRVSL